jgi:hypothetical protein
MVERGVFPQLLPLPELLEDDLHAIRVWLAMFAWAIEDNLLRGGSWVLTYLSLNFWLF